MSDFVENIKDQIGKIKQIKHTIVSIFTGLKNFWIFRKEIYRYRWWDYEFFMNTLESRLTHMEKMWEQGTHESAESDREHIQEVLAKIKEIKEIETTDDHMKEAENYEEYGKKMKELTYLMFSVRRLVYKRENKDIDIRETNLILTLWD